MSSIEPIQYLPALHRDCILHWEKLGPIGPKWADEQLFSIPNTLITHYALQRVDDFIDRLKAATSRGLSTAAMDPADKPRAPLQDGSPLQNIGAESSFQHALITNHASNYQLWQTEDCARRTDKGYEYVYHAKRSIDALNQKRNNCMESLDKQLYLQLQPSTHNACPVHSETPGMMIDRLSILSLKAFYMEKQTQRPQVDDQHRQHCFSKLIIIRQQQQQLYHCLQELIQEVQEQKRTFRLYQQFKMYNDPTLNPQLYE